MDFSLSEEQQGLRDLALQILVDQTSNEHLRETDAHEDRFDRKLWMDLAEAGLLGIGIGEAYGGMDLGYESLCLLVEAVGYTVAPVPVIPVLVSAALPIDRHGTQEQKQRLLPGVCAGEKILTAGLIERGNEDPVAPLTTAERASVGWVLNGQKSCVPFAHRAERVLVAAQAAGDVAVFLVDPGAEGVELRRQETTAHEPQFELLMNDVVVPAEDVLATPGSGLALIAWIAEVSTAASCAMAVGVSERAMRMTADYTSQREQFGQKIATFQAVGQRAANCYIDVQCSRLVTWQAVSLLNAGRETGDAVRIAKIWAGDVTHRVSHAAQHLHGGIGVDRDYPLFRYCLWAKQLELQFGSSAQQLAELGKGIAAEYRVC